MSKIEQIEDQSEWGRENLDSPQDNLSLDDVERLIEQAKKLERIKKAYDEADFSLLEYARVSKEVFEEKEVPKRNKRG